MLNVKQADVAEQVKAIVEGFRALAVLEVRRRSRGAERSIIALKVTAADKSAHGGVWVLPADARSWAHVAEAHREAREEMCQKIREHF